MFDFASDLPIRRQASILNCTRHKLYYKQVLNDDSEIANLIKDAYLYSDCRYGYRKITASLKVNGNDVNHKKSIKNYA